MGKVSNKKTNNSISHNNKGLETIDNPILNDELKDLYVSLIHALKGLKNTASPYFSKEVIINLAEELFKKNEQLTEEYSNKYIHSIYENNEIYNLFENTLKSNEDNYEHEISSLEKNLKNTIDEIENELHKIQQDSILNYKTQENIFLPKTRFLSYNKKIYKEEYIKIVTKINHNRILANQNYIATANDLSSINEQQQLKFKHSIESSIEKSNYDKSIIIQEANERVNKLNEDIEEIENQNKVIISQKGRQIIENTIELNELITKISNEYSNRLKYAYIPYDIKTNKLLDELNENGKSYNSIEEQVLFEFKALLQQNDNEIESLREKHKLYTDKYLKEIREIKKAFNSFLQKEINAINKNIAIATKKYTSSLKKEDKNIVKKLVAEKKIFIKKQNKIKDEKIEELQRKYYLEELEYIEKYELLRSKKSECEAIKSSAIKNINYERIYHNEHINSEVKLITNEKESFSTMDHYEETKDIYSIRLKYEIENENIRYEINEAELSIYQNKIEIKYKQDKIIAEKEYNIKLSEADLFYQQESINNRIDYFNVKTMLDIQRENIINNFEVLFANEMMNFEQVKNIFFINCDNIQYEIFKNKHELTYKLIDADVKLHQDLKEIRIQHETALINYKKSLTINEKNHQENIIQINLYENRLEVEKIMITDAYELFNKTMKSVIEFENHLHSLITTLYQEDFEYNKRQILIGLEYIRKIKLEIIQKYYNNEFKILNSRLNFEKGFKYKKQIENAHKEYKEFIENFNSRINKTRQTITSYKNTVNLSLDALRKNKKEIIKLHISVIKNLTNKQEFNRLKKDLIQCKENIVILKRQIKANRKNISKLRLLELSQKREQTFKEKKFNYRFDKIQRNQNNESKVFTYLLSLIGEQYNNIKQDIFNCGHYLSASKYNYYTIKESAIKIAEINYKILSMSRNYFDIHYAKFIELTTKQYISQKELYYKNFDRYNKEIKKSIKIECREYETNKLAIKNAYQTTVETLEQKTTYHQNELLLELKKITEKHAKNTEKFKQTIKKITNKKEYELACHDDNYNMYMKKYNETNTKIINSYLHKINEIKSQYNSTLIEIENKYKTSQKRIKAQHISNETLRKNNILNMNNEYKESIKTVNQKIKVIVKNDKFSRNKHEEYKKISYNLYIMNQRNTRKELTQQNKAIIKKCNARVSALKKEFKKNFKIKKTE